MPVFSKTHVEIIEERLRQSGLQNESIILDLIDHYCCIVEEEMDKGRSFDEAYTKAWNSISPNGTIEIEEELIFLLNLNNQIVMKKIMYLSGFFAASTITLSFLFRTLNWPGARVFHILGFSFLFITCLILLVNAIRNKSKLSKQEMARIVSGNSAAFLISLGSLFKSFYMPGANVMMLLGFVILISFYIPMFFHHLYKRSLIEA
jgi:hypothetical protein